VKIDWNWLNVLEKDYLDDSLMLIENSMMEEEHEDNEDCRIEVDDMDEYSITEIHV
jgi:hypothetical protein